MAFALLASVKAGALNGTTTAAINTTGAKLLLVSFVFNNGVTPTLTDSAGNTWTALTATSNTSTRSTRQYYCINPTTSATHTFTFGPASVLGSIVVSAWSAGDGVTFDKEVGGHASGTSITVAGAAASVTPANANSLLVTAFGFGASAVTASAGSGWTVIDAQDGAGSTNFGVGSLYQIQTTATTVAAGTVIGTAGGQGDNTDRTAVFFEAAGASLTITTPATFEVHQRSGTTGNIQISGSHTGSTENIEASFNGGAFQTIATASPAGAFSGTLTNQPQGQGTLTVRKAVTTSASAAVNDVGIGDVYVVVGDSLGEGRGTNAQVYTHATLKAADFRQDNLWKNGNDPSDTGTNIGSHWPLLASLLMADQGVPVAFITTATGSTDVAGTHAEWAKPAAEYNNMVTTVTNSTVSGVKAVLAQLGPNAIVNSNAAAIALATYRTALGTFATNVAADLAGAPPLFVGLAGQVTTGSPPDRRTAEDNIRGAVLGAVTLGTIKMGPNLLGQAYTDGVHPQTDASLLQLAQRWHLAIKEGVLGGAAGSGRGPRVVSAVWNVARTQMTVTFDRALKTGLTHSAAAWIVNDVGGVGVMTISSIAYHGSNPNALLLNVSTAATGANGSSRMTFGSGEDATGAVLPQSTDITIPVGGPVNLPAEPVYALAVTEATSLATTVTVTLTTDGTTPAANLTGLKWAFFDQVNPGSKLAPTAKGTTGSTNGSGVFSVSITGTALTAGQTGWLEVTNSDGTATQNPSGKVASGPVVTA